ncbi:hypothetical protein IIZ77_00935 [Candidatus Saccharibacteria bacterium]|nr:hypothetical protein [Candidatus Saccharibacteria bacterium]
MLAAGVDTDGISSFLLTDNRDNKTYKVRRLAEGKCHMVQNLDLNLADAASGTIVLNNRNTNLTTIETWVPDADISETFAENNAPRARDGGLAYVGSPTGTDTTYTSEHATRYVGDYYNWLAVGAGTGSTSTTDGIGDNNICPYN